jgi:hypothetical protein
MQWYPKAIHTPFGKLMIELGKYSESIFDESFLHIGQNRANVEKRIIFHQEYKAELANNNTVQPTGFIFHAGRCGSTLLAKMLSQLEGSRAIMEAPVLNSYLDYSLNSSHEDAQKAAIFRTITNGFSIDDKRETKHVFIKFTSWNIHFFKLILATYPSVPWIYVYRNPLETIVSNLDTVSNLKLFLQQKPDLFSHILGIKKTDSLEEMTDEVFFAQLLHSNFKTALSIPKSEKGLYIPYENIKLDFFSSILPHFNVKCTREEREKIIACGKLNSKSKDKLHFQEDTSNKQKKANDKLKDIATNFNLMNQYQMLKSDFVYK